MLRKVPTARWLFVCGLLGSVGACATTSGAAAPVPEPRSEAAPREQAGEPTGGDDAGEPRPDELGTGIPRLALTPHNTVRQEAGVSTLTWSETLAAAAATVAAGAKDACELAADTKLPYKAVTKRVQPAIDGAELVERWAAQPTIRARLVLPELRELGCAIDTCADGRQLWICLYGVGP